MNTNKHLTMSFSLLTVSLLLVTQTFASPNSPRLVPQKRATTYNGGWALGLPSEGCPADAPVNCQPVTGSEINPTCCPFGQTCFGFEQPYCCPSGTSSSYFLFLTVSTSQLVTSIEVWKPLPSLGNLDAGQLMKCRRH